MLSKFLSDLSCMFKVISHLSELLLTVAEAWYEILLQ